MLKKKVLFFGQTWIRKKNLWPLAPLSWVYAFFVWCRNFLYDAHILSSKKLKPVVVSVGNIFVGGMGKTPFTLFLANRFSHRSVAVLSRGYGAVPDEALLFAKKLPLARVLVGKDRSYLGSLVEDVDLILLDDGLQHRKLKKDFQIVLSADLKMRYLPWGFLRDSPKRLKEADLVLYKNKDFSLEVKRVLNSKGEELSSIKGKEVDLFCAIADPESFKETVSSLGAKIKSCSFFLDHEAIDMGRLPESKFLLCTEKDFVKLPLNLSLPVHYLEMELRILPSQNQIEKLIEKIEQKIDNRTQS